MVLLSYMRNQRIVWSSLTEVFKSGALVEKTEGFWGWAKIEGVTTPKTGTFSGCVFGLKATAITNSCFILRLNFVL